MTTSSSRTLRLFLLLTVVVGNLGLRSGVMAEPQITHSTRSARPLRGNRYTFQEALQRLSRNLPALLLAQRKLKGRQQSARYAGAFPNPSVTYRREQLFPLQGQDEAGVQITIPLGGRTWRTRDVAMARVRVQRWSVTLLQLKLQFRFLEKYFGLLHRTQRLALLAKTLRRFEKLYRIVRSRVKGGKLSGAYLLRIELEMRQRRTQLLRLLSIVRREGQTLGYQIGKAGQTLIPTGSLVPPITSPYPELTQTLLSNLPYLRHMKAQKELAQEQQKQAYAQAWPDLQLSLGYLHATNTGQAQTDGHGFYVGISLPLPFFNRNQFQASQARQKLRLTSYKVQLLLRQYRFQIVQLRRQLQQAYQRLKQYQSGVSQRIPELLRSARAAFVGGVSVRAYLDIQATVERLQLFELSLQKDIRMLSLQYHQLIGRIPQQ